MARIISMPGRNAVLAAMTRLSELRAHDLCRYYIMNDHLTADGHWITRIVNSHYMKPFSVPCYTPNKHMPVSCLGGAGINGTGHLVMTLATNCSLSAGAPVSVHTFVTNVGVVASTQWLKPEKILAVGAVSALRRACIHLSWLVDNLKLTEYQHFNFSLTQFNDSAVHFAAKWGSDFSYMPLVYGEYLASHPVMETSAALTMVAILLTKFASTFLSRYPLNP